MPSIDNPAPLKVTERPKARMSRPVPPKVIIKARRFINPHDIQSIVCHRERQFLVRWATDPADNISAHLAPYSWECIDELSQAPNNSGVSSLYHVQNYLASYTAQPQDNASLQIIDDNPKKRKQSPLSFTENGRQYVPKFSDMLASSRLSPSEDSKVLGIPLSTSDSSLDDKYRKYHHLKAYNCKPKRQDDGQVKPCPVDRGVDSTLIPTPLMLKDASRIPLTTVYTKLREHFKRRLQSYVDSSVSKKSITLVNEIDDSVPPLSFRMAENYVYREGVEPPDINCVEGCQKCKPDMAHKMGCEYSQLCDCLEFAEVNEAALQDHHIAQYNRWVQREDSSLGLPKRFPYKNNETLQASYLQSRHAIYECNFACKCGPDCKTKVTQRGRNIPLEIFKTSNRGWGLRSTFDVKKGQFIDMYFGEVITEDECKKREERASKNSYIFSLDKFKEEMDVDASSMLLVDGEFIGGPTRFINHSCDPNCGVYAVSYNKHDVLRYNLGFFALDNIKAGTEFTFDYTENDEDRDDEEDEEGIPSSSQAKKPIKSKVPCLCGSENCREWLWI